MSKRKKDKNLVILLCVTALVGAVNLILNRNFMFLLLYIPIMVVSILWLYFNYSLCKWENKWHSRWHERTPCDGEPSFYRLTAGKIGEWILFICGLIMALIPSM